MAREVNDAVPSQAVQLLAELSGGLSGLQVAVLGAAYRSGVKETAFSGVFAIVRELALRGATPVVHDPLYGDAELRRLGLEPYRFGEPCDAVITHTDHPEYKLLTPRTCPVSGRWWMAVRSWTPASGLRSQDAFSASVSAATRRCGCPRLGTANNYSQMELQRLTRPLEQWASGNASHQRARWLILGDYGTGTDCPARSDGQALKDTGIRADRDSGTEGHCPCHVCAWQHGHVVVQYRVMANSRVVVDVDMFAQFDLGRYECISQDHAARPDDPRLRILRLVDGQPERLRGLVRVARGPYDGVCPDSRSQPRTCPAQPVGVGTRVSR